jgi:hypothetical protein
VSVGDMVRMNFPNVDLDYWGVGVIIEVDEDRSPDDVCVYWTGEINRSQWEMPSMLAEE